MFLYVHEFYYIFLNCHHCSFISLIFHKYSRVFIYIYIFCSSFQMHTNVHPPGTGPDSGMDYTVAASTSPRWTASTQLETMDRRRGPPRLSPPETSLSQVDIESEAETAREESPSPTKVAVPSPLPDQQGMGAV